MKKELIYNINLYINNDNKIPLLTPDRKIFVCLRSTTGFKTVFTVFRELRIVTVLYRIIQ